MEVSIIIVNYNTSELLKNCLASIFKQTKDIDFEVIVCDNASSDDSVKMIKNDFSQVILIENKKNLGFGAANNQGLKVAKGKYIFYLNSDTLLKNNAVKIFYNYFENAISDSEVNNLGAIGTNLYDKEMSIIHSYGHFAGYKIAIPQLIKMFFLNIVLSILYIFRVNLNRCHKSDIQQKYIGEVDYITGADLFLLNDEFAKFDENFFLYFEEADLQKNMMINNKKRILIDGPIIQHFCGGSVQDGFSIKRKASFSRIQFELSRVKFLKKHYSKTLLPLAKIIITLIWINPFLVRQTKKYIKELWKI